MNRHDRRFGALLVAAIGLPVLGCQGESEPVPSSTPADQDGAMYMEAYATYAANVDPAIPFEVEYELVDTRHLDRRAGEIDDWTRLVKSSQHLVPFDRNNGILKPKFALWGQNGYPAKEAFHEIPADFVPVQGSGTTQPVPISLDAGSPSYCGDGICNAYEDCGSCSYDCGSCPVQDAGSPSYCGDGICDAYEDCSWCSYDCGSCPVQDAGSPSYCGDGICDAYEDCSWCSYDCGSCPGGDAGIVDAGVVDAPVLDGGTCSSDGCCVECQECGCTDCSTSEVETSSGTSASVGKAAPPGVFNLLMPTDRELGDIGPASKAELWRVSITIGKETREHYAMIIHHEKLAVIADDTLLAVNLYAPIISPEGVAMSRDTLITTAAAWQTTIRPDGCEQHSLVVEDSGIRETRYVTIFMVHYDDGFVRARIAINIDCERVTDAGGNATCRALNCSVTQLQGSESCDSLSGWCLASTHYCGESSSSHCAKTTTNDGFDLAAGQRSVHSTNSSISVTAALGGPAGDVSVSFTDNGGTLHAAQVTENGVRGCSLPRARP